MMVAEWAGTGLITKGYRLIQKLGQVRFILLQPKWKERNMKSEIKVNLKHIKGQSETDEWRAQGRGNSPPGYKGLERENRFNVKSPFSRK